jgi:hypothetical protein
VACFVVSHEVPTDVPGGSSQFTYLTEGIDTAVRQAEARRRREGRLDFGRGPLVNTPAPA